MNKYYRLLVIALITIASLLPVSALEEQDSWVQDYLSSQNFSEAQLNKSLTVKWVFILYFNALWEWIPDSYKYIDLKFTNVIKWSPIYDALQKWVYLDLINNTEKNLPLERIATQSMFNDLVKNNFDYEIKYTANTALKLVYFLQVMDELKSVSEEWVGDLSKYEIANVSNFEILNDVFVKVKNYHYDSSTFKDEELIRWAMKWLAESTWDKYTNYFPPSESKNFIDSLAWEFEWIWAQVDMEKPWILMIISPLAWSPAEKAWLKWWDRIMKINGQEVTEKMSLIDAVSLIKWPKWTEVKLTILRKEEILEISVIRDRIVLKYVEYKKLDNWYNYISISTFWAWTYSWFKTALEEVKKNPSAKTIIDLRNNPGWSLDEVTNVLNYFVDKWLPTVNIRYRNLSTDTYSLWTDDFTFMWKKIIILINEWSASASEIMAWTIKDYFWNDAKIVWKKSLWKWSVQVLEEYYDESSFKYTIAKWFTWKTRTWIDWIWIKPDIEVEKDEQKAKLWIDNVLEYAKTLAF